MKSGVRARPNMCGCVPVSSSRFKVKKVVNSICGLLYCNNCPIKKLYFPSWFFTPSLSPSPHTSPLSLSDSLFLGCPEKKGWLMWDWEKLVIPFSLFYRTMKLSVYFYGGDRQVWLPNGLTASHSLLQLKQTLLILVLLHDNTGHLRTREPTQRYGQRGLWVTD